MSLSPREGTGSEVDQRGGPVAASAPPGSKREGCGRCAGRGLGVLGERPQEGSEVTGKVGRGEREHSRQEMAQGREGCRLAALGPTRVGRLDRQGQQHRVRGGKQSWTRGGAHEWAGQGAGDRVDVRERGLQCGAQPCAPIRVCLPWTHTV